jgi:small-conductance mechanosensitive channel
MTGLSPSPHTSIGKGLLRAGFVLFVLASFALWRLPDGTRPIHQVTMGLWHRITAPVFTMGTLAFTPLFVLKAVLFLAVLAAIANWVRRLLYVRASRTTAFDPQHSYVFARFASLLIYVFGLMVGLQAAGVSLNSLAVVGGTLGIGIGFGLQSIVANWVAGLVLLIEQPFRIGDRIDVGETSGVIGRVRFRSTWVRTYDNEIIIVPNSEFTTHRVTNWTVNDDKVRLAINLVVPHDRDPQEVANLIFDVARHHPDVLPDPAPEPLLSDVTLNALTFSLRFWAIVRADDNQRIKSELRVLILQSLRQHGIEAASSSVSPNKVLPDDIGEPKIPKAFRDQTSSGTTNGER